MSSLYSTLLNGQVPRQNPSQFHQANRTEETITNYEQLYVYNSHPVIQRSHEPNIYNPTAGWPGSTSRANNSSVPSTFLEQIQTKNQLLVKNKEVMEKQATYISHLEKQLDEQSMSNDLIRRLQDRERDVEHLRARLETEIAPKYEVENLRRNLGEAEYELEKTEKALQETLNDKAAEVNNLEEKISGRVKELDQSKREIKRLEKEKSELLTRIENLDKYVGDLPTSEDYKKLRKEQKHWKHQCSKLQTQMMEQEERLTSGKKGLEEKALNADRFERENIDLRRMVKNLQDRIKNDKMHSKALELEHVTFENERLQADLAKMEKLLQERQRKAKHFYIQSQESQKKLEERLSHEEDTVAALREEISIKELSISELKSSMKQISSQLQDSVEENMDINDKLKKLQIINCKESLETNRKIYKQLRRNVNKLKDLVKLYYQRKEGRDLELSLLLGTAAGEASRTMGNHEQSLSDEVSALTTDIDELRTFLADQYAEELANNIEGNNCITQ